MIKIISTKKSWIEGNAIQQLEKVAELKGVKSVVGLPDLHSGPVGMAMASEKYIYPHLVGNDIGCGFGFWKTDALVRKIKRDKWGQKLKDLELPYEGDIEEFAKPFNITPLKMQSALGTIGGGNHFAELQKVKSVHDEKLFYESGMNKNYAYLLVHSGSRSLGKNIFERFSVNQKNELCINSEDGTKYIEEHNYAVNWAKCNRALIAKRFLESLSMKGKLLFDLTHNSVSKENFEGAEYWIHRKGASPNNEGFAIIAGSRGSLSYLVKPTGNLQSSNYSIAHGAGRKLNRTEMDARLRKKFTVNSLTQTSFGSKVICEDKKLLYEEAPEAYKNITKVIEDLKVHGLIKVVASLQPVITYKTRGAKWN